MSKNRTSIFVNPFLMAILKNIWLAESGAKNVFSEDDYGLLGEYSSISLNSLKRRVIRSDETVFFFKISTLNSLCKGVKKKVGSFWPDWQAFQNRYSQHPTYKDCEKLLKRTESNTKIRIISDKHRKLAESIQRHAIAEAIAHFQLYPLVQEGNAGHNIPLLDPVLFDAGIKIASMQDIDGIYRLAVENRSYGDCELNGPEKKIPWWTRNRNIFFVFHDQNGKVCANLNILPIKEVTYQALRKGELEEADIQPEDIYQTHQRDQIRYVLVEGFNSPNPTHAYLFLVHIFELASQIVPDPLKITVGAFGATNNGVKTMRRMNFKEITCADKSRSGYPFLEVAFKDLPPRFRNSLSIIEN